MKKAAVVFTFKSVERIIGVDGGTQSWRLHRSHIGTFDYVIGTRNQCADAEGPEAHRSAFLIGKVRDIVPSTEPYTLQPGHPPYKRYLIRMSEAALITDKPEFWQFGRWPLHIDTLGALGIDPDKYDFKTLQDLIQEIRKTSESLWGPPLAPLPPPPRGPAPFSGWRERVDRAKADLAAEFGLDPGAIDITVRM